MSLFLFLLVIGSAARQAISQPKPAKNYEKKQILFLKWGSGDGDKEIKVLGNPFCGPRAMAIDKDENIYIPDPANNRIQKFSIRGDLIKSISTDSSASALHVGENGDIFTARAGKVLRIENNGKKIQYEQKWGTIYNDSLLDESGNKVFSFGEIPSISSKFNEPLFLKKDTWKSYDRSDKKNVKEIIFVKMDKINQNLEKKGKKSSANILKLSFEQKKGSWLSWKVLGFDDCGNVYILVGYVELSYQDLTEEKIQIYSMEGKLISEIPVEVDSCFWSSLNERLFSVDKQGDMFQLLNSKSGVYVYKWVKD